MTIHEFSEHQDLGKLGSLIVPRPRDYLTPANSPTEAPVKPAPTKPVPKPTPQRPDVVPEPHVVPNRPPVREPQVTPGPRPPSTCPLKW
jgi:hypothetical protein